MDLLIKNFRKVNTTTQYKSIILQVFSNYKMNFLEVVESSNDAPLNLSLKSSKSSSTPTDNSKNNNSQQKDLDLVSVNNLSNLQNLTAGIGMFANDNKREFIFNP